MAYQDFLQEFAIAQGVGDKKTLLSEYKDRFSFPIKSRKRAREMIDLLRDRTSIDFSGKAVLGFLDRPTSSQMSHVLQGATFA